MVQIIDLPGVWTLIHAIALSLMTPGHKLSDADSFDRMLSVLERAFNFWDWEGETHLVLNGDANGHERVVQLKTGYRKLGARRQISELDLVISELGLFRCTFRYERPTPASFACFDVVDFLRDKRKELEAFPSGHEIFLDVRYFGDCTRIIYDFTPEKMHTRKAAVVVQGKVFNSSEASEFYNKRLRNRSQ